MPLFFSLCVAEYFFCVTQVDAFLEANDTGVTDADREVAKGQ
jgi:hypothetical protein